MKIAVLVSGGVDSSVALALLKEQGHDVTAFYLKIWLEDELSYLGNCPWEEDLAYVQAVCAQLKVPLEVISLQKEYWDTVVSYTIAEVKAGRTPNPDILCNQRIKFGAFFDTISLDYEKVATGHYAQLYEQAGIYYVHKAPDPIKDQTYFLATLRQNQLARALFPIGHLAKAQVREYAHTLDLPNKTRKDSQGICFLGKLKFTEFIRYHVGDRVGEIKEFESGMVLGQHQGFWYYTIGQRQGLGLAGGPWYVMAKNPEDNIVYVSRSYHDENKARDTFSVGHMQWVVKPDPSTPLQVKLRHGPAVTNCTILSDEKNKIVVRLAVRDQGIAPGQFAVFYEDTLCVGAGIILNEEIAESKK